MLKGVAAAAVGLILATAVQLGKRSLPHGYDLIFVAATVIGVNRLHQSVLTVLVAVGLVAILWYHPKAAERRRGGHSMNEIPALIRVFAYLSLLTVGGGMAAFPETEDPHRRRPPLAHLSATCPPVQRRPDGARTRT